MNEVERFIYEYRIDGHASEHPELIVAIIKVNVHPKTYKRVGRPTWHSYTTVWSKKDLGKVVAGHVILEERDDAKALELFIAEELKNVSEREEYLQKAIDRCNRVKAIPGAIEDTEC